MAYELIYTSVPQGIKSGSSGFCTVAYTQGLAANIALKLEGMSAYKPYFPHYDSNAAKNPVSFSHYSTVVSGETLHFLSRVCFYGLDYTKRSNKLAHHYVLRNDEVSLIKAGPAALCGDKALFVTEWNQLPQLFRQQKMLRNPLVQPGKASCWEAYTGDAGWAGTLVQYYLDNAGSKPAWIIFDPLVHTNILRLVTEALKLLPEKQRWDVCFSTYFMNLPAGMNCHWRFCTPDSEALKDARKIPNNLIIDLTNPLVPAGNGELENRARTGALPPPPPQQQIPQQQMPQTAQNPRGARMSLRSFGKTTPQGYPAEPPAAQNFQMPTPGSGRCKGFKAVERKSPRQTLMPFIILLLLLVIGILVTVLFMMYKDSGVPEISGGEIISPADSSQNAAPDAEKLVSPGSNNRKNKSEAAPRRELLRKSAAVPEKDDARKSAVVPPKKGDVRKSAAVPQKGGTASAAVIENRKMLFAQNLNINKSFRAKKGTTLLPKVLENNEKLKSVKLQCYLLSVNGPERDGDPEYIELKDDMIAKSAGSEMTSEGVKMRYLYQYSVSYKDGHIIFKECNPHFDKNTFCKIVELKTTKNAVISLKFNPQSSVWPSKLKDGQARFFPDLKNMEIVCTYKSTPLDDETGMFLKNSGAVEIRCSSNGEMPLQFKEKKGAKGVRTFSYLHSAGSEALKRVKELEKIEKELESLRKNHPEEFDEIVRDVHRKNMSKKEKKQEEKMVEKPARYRLCPLNALKSELSKKDLLKKDLVDCKLFEESGSLKDLLDGAAKQLEKEKTAVKTLCEKIKNGKIEIFRGEKLLKCVNYGEKSR